MPTHSYPTDSFWLATQTPPPHTPVRLTLKPIGMNTLHVESLSGYIARLAQLHAVTTEELLMYQVLPLMRDKGFLIDAQAIFHLFYRPRHQTPDDESQSHLQQELVQTLANLTGQQDILRLGLLRWASTIFNWNLLRPYQAWCPLCYQQWRDDNRIIYLPLLWLMASSEVCLLHPHQVLQEHCPHCYQQFRALTPTACPGYCSQCHQWLGHASLLQTDHPSPPDLRQPTFTQFCDHGLHWRYWWLDQIEQVVANTPTAFSPPKHSLAADSKG